MRETGIRKKVLDWSSGALQKPSPSACLSLLGLCEQACRRLHPGGLHTLLFLS